MSSIPANLPLRNDLIGEEPYGAPQLDVPVCLNVNENPYAPDPAVCDTIAKRVREIAPTLNRYPDREHIELRQAFSDYLARESGTRLDVDELWGANGSNEIMLQLFQAFGGPGRTALGADPTYSMYPEYARDTFTGWKLAHRNADFTLNVDKVLEAIAEVKPSMVLLTSPNNPTGTPLPMEDIERILAACETAEVVGAGEGVHPILVIDEAYVEFRKPGHPERREPDQGPPELGRQPHHEQGLRLRRCASRLPGRVQGHHRLRAYRTYAVPPVRRDSGRRTGRLRTHRRAAEPCRAPARNPRGHRRMAQGTDLQGPAA